MNKRNPVITKEKVRAQLDALYETRFIDVLIATPGVRVLLFGGPIRDMVRGEQWKDADIRVVVEKPDIREREKVVEDALKKAGVKIKERVRREEISLTVYRFLPRGSKTIYDVDISLMPTLDISSSDFVFNSLFFDLKTGELIDKYGAVKDIKNKVLRTVKKSEVEFRNNPIAIFRVLRQACQYGLRIEKKTMLALASCAKYSTVPLRYVVDIRSDMWAEYYLANILKGFSCGARKYFSLLSKTGIYLEMERFLAKRLQRQVLMGKVKNPFSSKQRNLSPEKDIALFLSFISKRMSPENPEMSFKMIKQLLTLNTKKKYKDFVLDQRKIVFVP